MPIRLNLWMKWKQLLPPYPLFTCLIMIKSSHFMTRGVNRMNIIRIKITLKMNLRKGNSWRKQIEKLNYTRRSTDTYSQILYQWQYPRILCSLSKLHEAYTQKRNKQSKAKVPQGNTGNTQNLDKLKQAWIINGLKRLMQFAVHATIPILGPTAWF